MLILTKLNFFAKFTDSYYKKICIACQISIRFGNWLGLFFPPSKTIITPPQVYNIELEKLALNHLKHEVFLQHLSGRKKYLCKMS